MLNSANIFYGINDVFFDVCSGINLLIDMSRDILMTKSDSLLLKKDKALKFLKERVETTTSQLSKYLDISYEETFFVIKQLEKDGKIVIS